VTSAPPPVLARRAWLAIVASPLLGSLAAAAPAGATHLPDHRFIVLGYLAGADGRPLGRTPVVVTRLKTGLEYPVRSEGDGFYLAVVHLHDEDQGERLRVRAGGAAVEVRARFDVRDRKVERGTRLDLQGGVWREDRARFAETLRAFLAR
jgi:hypothetical protein